MGGFGSVLSDMAAEAGEQMFKSFKTSISDDAGYGFVRSTKALLEKSDAGKILSKYLSEEMEPAVRKAGQTYMKQRLTPGLPPKQATQILRDIGSEAWHDTRKMYLGKGDEVIVKAIAAGTKQRGLGYGDAMADALSVYLHDAGSYWRKTDTVVGPGQKINLAKDLGIRGTPKYTSPKEWENSLFHSLSFMRTQGIAIPHISQVVNPFLREGIGSTAKALAEWSEALVKTGKPDKYFQDVIDSGILWDEFRYEALSDAKTPGGSLFDKLFNRPAFNWVRRQQITMTALAGKHHAINAAGELSAGINTKMNTFTLNRLGIDTNSLARKGFQLSQDEIQKAMYQAGTQNIFVRSELETPWKWQESFGMRMVSQYRHFNFRQTKFIYQTIRDSLKYGGVKELAKTLAVWGTFFPVAGEFIKDLENLSMGKAPNNPFSADKKFSHEYADAMAHAAGWGIFFSLSRAGMRQYGRGFFEGPLFSTLDDIVIGVPTHLYQGVEYGLEGDEDKSEKQLRAAARLTLSQFGVPGKFASEQLKEEK